MSDALLKFGPVYKEFIESEMECSAPSFVYWLSETKRNKCINARMNAYNGMIKYMMNISDSNIQNSKE